MAIQALAAASYNPERGRLIGEMSTEIRRLTELLAHHGVVGGSGVTMTLEIGGKSIRERYGLAAQSLIDACRSRDVDYYPELMNDLLEGFGVLVAAEPAQVTNQLTQSLAYVPARESIASNAAAVVTAADADGLARARAQFEHLAAQREAELRRREAEAVAADKRAVDAGRLTLRDKVAIAGVAITATTVVVKAGEYVVANWPAIAGFFGQHIQ
jgi:hypothetical protein